MEHVRKAAFETNSSSTHSIVIEHGEFVASKLPVVKGEVEIFPGEFGWEIADYNDPATKASYCLTYLMASANKVDFDSKSNREVVRFRMSNVDSVTHSVEVQRRLHQLSRVIEEETGAIPVFSSVPCGWYPWGYIDHQSHGVCAEAFDSDESLRNFIFNPNSTLHTDNDNH